MAERRVDDDRDDVVRVVLEEGHDGVVELAEAGHGPAFGGDVGAVYDTCLGMAGVSQPSGEAEVRYGRSRPLRSGGVIRAVLWDFGGVILTSPFAAFERYELELGLPAGFIRQVNATNPHDNAWARLERSDITVGEFVVEFEREADALGGAVSGQRVVELLAGDIRPAMVTALRRLRAAGFPRPA